MNISDCYKIGFVLKLHGLKGEVTVAIDDDIPNDFETLDAVFFEINGQMIPYFIADVSMNRDKAFVKFEDVDTIEAAQEIVKKAIYLPKQARPESEKGGFYDDEIIGFSVSDVKAGDMGTVQDIMTAGPNKLLVIDFAGKEVLIPINGPFITDVDKIGKKMTVDLPEGFLDL